jgi:hypothetical protein
LTRADTRNRGNAPHESTAVTYASESSEQAEWPSHGRTEYNGSDMHTCAAVSRDDGT